MSDRFIPDPFAVITTRLEERVDVAVSGELDITSNERLATAIHDAAGQPGPGRVVLDLGRVTLIDSSAIRTILLARGSLRAQGSTLIVGTMSVPVERTLQLIGLVDVLRSAV